MLRIRAGLAAALLPVVLSGVASAQAVDARVDSLFARFATRASPGCEVGVRQRGVTVLERAYGMADLEHDVPLTPASRSESGSVAKQFTAAAIVLLARDGKLSLADDIRRWLPEVPDFGHPIAIRHLLNHTSGLRDQWGLLALVGRAPGSAVHTLDEILDLVSRQRELNFAPGTEFLYSNTGYALLAMIVDRASGSSLADFTRSRLFTPLGMTHTEWRDDYTRIVPDRAIAYDGTFPRFSLDMPFTMVYGNGGLLTTAGDLLIWNDYLTSGSPGVPSVGRDLETRGLLRNGRTIAYALGMSVLEFRGVKEVSHSGSTAGYRAFLARYPDHGLSVALLCNLGSVNPSALGRQVAAVWLGSALSAAPSPVTADSVKVTAGNYAAYAGIYADSATDSSMRLDMRDGRLMMAMPGGGWMPLYAVGRTRFRAGGWLVVLGAPGSEVLAINGDDTTRFQRMSPAADTSALAVFAGTYESEELGVSYVVAVRDGRLEIRRRPDPALVLLPVYRDDFSLGGRTIRFSRDAQGRIDGFRIYAGRVRGLRFVLRR